jgi:hypothetical protein
MFTSLKQSHSERVSLRQLCFLFSIVEARSTVFALVVGTKRKFYKHGFNSYKYNKCLMWMMIHTNGKTLRLLQYLLIIRQLVLRFGMRASDKN